MQVPKIMGDIEQLLQSKNTTFSTDTLRFPRIFFYHVQMQLV